MPTRSPKAEALIEASLNRLAALDTEFEEFKQDWIGFAVEQSRGDLTELESMLSLLSDFALSLRTREFALWTPFSFAIKPWGKSPSLTAHQLSEILGALKKLIIAALDAQIDITLGLQKGMRQLPGLVSYDVQLFAEVLTAATRLAEQEMDPDRFLEFVPEACHKIAGQDVAAFRLVYEAFEKFCTQLQKRGFGFVYPFAKGLSDVAATHTGRATEFVALFADFIELVDLLRAHDHSPYGTFEYGLSAAFQAQRSPEDSRWIMDTALALASFGESPQSTLSFSVVEALNCQDPVRSRAQVMIQSLSSQGVSNGPFFQYTWPELVAATPASGDLVAHLGWMEKIHLAGHAQKSDLLRIFRDGIPPIFHRDFETLSHAPVWEFTLKLLEHRLDAGYIIPHGLAYALRTFEASPALIEQAYALATAELEAGIAPTALLQGGPEVVVLVCAEQPNRQKEIFLKLHELLLELGKKESSGGDPRVLFTQGIMSSAKRIGPHPDAYLKLIGRLHGYISEYRSQGLPVVETLNSILSVGVGGPQSEKALEIGTLLTSSLQPFGHAATALLNAVLPALSEVCPQASDARHVIARLERLLWKEPLSEDEVANLVKGMERLSAVVELVERDLSRLIGLLDGWLSLDLSSQGNLAFLSSTVETAAGFSTEVFSTLRSLSISSWAPAKQKEFVLVLLPAVLTLARKDPKSILEHQKELFRVAERPLGGLDPAEMGGFHRLLADQCQSLQQFLGLVTQLDIQELQQSGKGKFPLSSIAHALLPCAESAEVFVRVFRAVVKASKVELYTRDRQLLVFGSLFPLLATLKTVGIDPVEAFKTSLQLAEYDFEVDTRGYFFFRLAELSPLFKRLPLAWKELIQPLPGSQGRGCLLVIHTYFGLHNFLQNDTDLGFLKQIVTQSGVRAVDIMKGLLRPCLERGIISDLGQEAPVIREFIETVAFNDDELYQQYAAIHKDSSLSSSERKTRTQKLKDEVNEVVDSVVSGRVREGLDQSSIFFRVMFQVFPPSYSADSSRYRAIYESFPDHSDHILSRTPGEPEPEMTFAFSSGGYVLKSGVLVDPEPWQFLVDAFEQSRSLSSVPLRELGQTIFLRWVQNQFSSESRVELTALIYAYFLGNSDPLPTDLQDPQCLIKLKGFLEDTAQEVILNAMGEYYASTPSTFLENSQNKVVPLKHVGKGLVRAIQKTVNEFQGKRVDAPLAENRLRQQLKGFDLSDSRLLSRLLSSTQGELEALLNSLKPDVQAIEPTQVYARIFADLYGDKVAAMKRELFGDGKSSSKVEFKKTANSADQIKVRFQVTKRRTHSVLGMCEGVCVATDLQLWNRPEFMQVAFWGPDRVALGGMHVLLIDVGGKTYLSLPGINPTLTFLKHVRAEELLDRVLDFARHLAQKWGLAGVWIPTAPSIHSNRAELIEAIASRNFPSRPIPSTEFSYSPYRYRIDQVFDVT